MGAAEREVGMTSDDGFDEFYQSAFGRLVGQVYLVTGDLGDAEDAVQEAFARASTRWAQVRDFNVPEQWVRRVAMNLAVDGLRRARRRLSALARLGPGPVAPPISIERVALAEALRTLPRSYRQEIVNRWPEVAVVAHTAYADETYVREMVAAGARGYVLKGDVPAAVLEALS